MQEFPSVPGLPDQTTLSAIADEYASNPGRRQHLERLAKRERVGALMRVAALRGFGAVDVLGEGKGDYAGHVGLWLDVRKLGVRMTRIQGGYRLTWNPTASIYRERTATKSAPLTRDDSDFENQEFCVLFLQSLLNQHAKTLKSSLSQGFSFKVGITPKDANNRFGDFLTIEMRHHAGPAGITRTASFQIYWIEMRDPSKRGELEARLLYLATEFSLGRPLNLPTPPKTDARIN